MTDATHAEGERFWFAGDRRTRAELILRLERMLERLDRIGREYSTWYGRWPTHHDEVEHDLDVRGERTGCLTPGGLCLEDYRWQEGAIRKLLASCPDLAPLCVSRRRNGP